MMEDEKYVREMWERVSCAETGLNGYVVCAVINDRPRRAELLSEHAICCDEAEAWSAAAEFTRTRLQQIRQVEEEISLLSGWKWIVAGNSAASRILARETEALEALKKGMK